MQTIRVFDITGERAIMDNPDGENVFKLIKASLDNAEDVVVDFENVTTILSMFLNSAIAPLYQFFSSEFLNNHLKIKNMSDDDISTLRRVNERARQFYLEERDKVQLSPSEVYGE